LGAAAYQIDILAIADHWSRSPLAADRERAVRLVPRSGLLHERLAELQDNQIAELERATALEPVNARYWERLGSEAEIGGDLQSAEHALLAAAERSRLYQPRYLLAQYYFRRGNRTAFEHWAHSALDVAPGDVTPLLDLTWRMTGASIGELAIHTRPLIARQIVSFLGNHGQAEAARQGAEHLAEVGGSDDLGALLGYTNLMLAGAKVGSAREIWNVLCRRRLVPYAPGEGVTNGDYAHPPMSGGFDWHFEPSPGVMLGRTPGALRATFTGSQPEWCLLAWQYVQLRKGSPVRLIQEVPADPGIAWVFFTPGKSEWMPWNGQGPAPTNIARLALVYRRPSGVPRLEGTATISAVRLEITQ
jgi:hypothetical protein